MARHMGNFHDVVEKVFFFQGTIYIAVYIEIFLNFLLYVMTSFSRFFYLAINIMLYVSFFSPVQCSS